jgi:hypothetical protein
MREDNDYSQVNLSAGKFSLKDVRPVTAKRAITNRQTYLNALSGGPAGLNLTKSFEINNPKSQFLQLKMSRAKTQRPNTGKRLNSQTEGDSN